MIVIALLTLISASVYHEYMDGNPAFPYVEPNTFSSFLKKRLFIVLFLILPTIILIVIGFFVFQRLNSNSPQKQFEKAIGDYKSTDVKTIAEGFNIDTLRSIREDIIDISLKADAALISGDKAKSLEALNNLKKRIEFQSRGDKANKHDVDKNNNGISDYLEELYATTTNIINQVQKR